VICGVFARTAGKYGDRAVRYVHLEAGHVGQSLLLQAVALGLGGVPIGAFDDAGVRRVLNLPTDHEPLYLIPIGRPASG
jgi:SagB-type dehydrogenase family enzyme